MSDKAMEAAEEIYYTLNMAVEWKGPSIPQCYYRDASGALMYDSNGNIMQGPCAPGDIGTTPYPGG